MDHDGHGGLTHGAHGGMDMSCPMSMVWNWDSTDICILTPSWRISTLTGFYTSLAVIMIVGVLYEWLRLYIRRLDAQIARSVVGASEGQHRRRASILPTSIHSSTADSANLGRGGRSNGGTSPTRSVGSTSSKGSVWSRRMGLSATLPISQRAQAWRSSLYAFSVLISFLLMLVAMTFNGWIIGAIVLGAGLGHYWFNRDLASLLNDDKGLACHS